MQIIGLSKKPELNGKVCTRPAPPSARAARPAPSARLLRALRALTLCALAAPSPYSLHAPSAPPPPLQCGAVSALLDDNKYEIKLDAAGGAPAKLVRGLRATLTLTQPQPYPYP